jgi:magnesium transporter
MLTAHVYRDGVLQEKSPDVSSLRSRLEDEGNRLWVDAEGASEDELSLLREQFDLHPLSIEDSLHWNQRSKVEVFPNYYFVVVHGLKLDDRDRLVDSELHLFVGKGFLITVRAEPEFDLAGVRERLARQPELMAEGGGFLLYLLLDEIVDDYLTTVERYEDLSDEVEDHVFSDDEETDVQADIFRMKREIVRFRRLVAPLREVIDMLQEHPHLVTQIMAPYYRDVLDHVIRTLEFIDNIRDLLGAALEAQLSQVSNRLNVIMKKLTSWAGIVLVPTLIAGIYGMNFKHMPELDWKLGYPMALGLMALVGYALYRGFKKRDWL